MGQILVGDPHAVVLHLQDDPVAVHGDIGMDKAGGGGIFDAVFNQIIEDLVHIVLGGQHHGVLACLKGQRHALVPGHHAQHTAHTLQNRCDLHGDGLLHGAAVKARQAQQVLRNAAEPVGLLADVAHKFPRHARVDVLRLQNGIGEQTNTGQRRFQLVGGVRHKAAPCVLRGLQTVGQAVELARDLGDLVAAADLGTVGIGALAHLADGLQQISDARSERMGQQHTQAHHQQRNHGGNAHQIRLEAAQQLRLLRIVLIGAHRADDLIAENHRRGGTA